MTEPTGSGLYAYGASAAAGAASSRTYGASKRGRIQPVLVRVGGAVWLTLMSVRHYGALQRDVDRRTRR